MATSRGPSARIERWSRFSNPLNDTFWVQGSTDPVPVAGTAIALNDTAPTDHVWNFAAVEILPLPAPTIAWRHAGGHRVRHSRSAAQPQMRRPACQHTFVFAGAGTTLPIAPAQISVGHLHACRHRELVDVATTSVPITVSSAGDRLRRRCRSRSGTRSPAPSPTRPGHSGQSHLVYRPMPACGGCSRCRLRTTRSAIAPFRATSAAGRISRRRPGPPKAASPHARLRERCDQFSPGRRRDRSASAVRSVSGVDYAHVFVSSAFDGQTSSNGHARATLGATTISWGAWNSGLANTASKWQGPLNSRQSAGGSGAPHVVGAIRSASPARRLHPSLQRHDGSGSRLRGRPVDQRGHVRYLDERIRHGNASPAGAGRDVAALDDRRHRQDDDARVQGVGIRAAGI